MSRPAERNRDATTRATWGEVAVTPIDDVVAGSFGTWTVTYTVGAYAMDVGGGLKIGTRRQADFGTPQFADPAAPNYVTIECSRPSKLKARFDARGHVRPYRAVIVIDVEEGPLYPGDTIVVTLGDRTGGSPGMAAQTFPESECEFAVFVDPISSGVYKRVFQTTPPVRVVPAPSEWIEVIVPSVARAGIPFRAQVRGNDRFGNPAAVDAGKMTLEADPPLDIALGIADGRSKWLDGVTVATPGVRRLKLRSGSRIVAESNPVVVRPKEEAGLDLFWGDTQAQTASTVGIGSVAEYYAYARDLAGIDFVTHQGNDFMLSEADVDEVRRESKRFHEPGRFVPYFGYEWSGATGAGGDRNIMYLDDDGPIWRSSGWQLDPSEDTPATETVSARDLQDRLRAFIAANGDRVLSVPHIGGRRSDVDVQDPDLEPVFEICSCHGIFEWRLREAFKRGMKLGVVGASDDHTGRPGLAYPSTPEMTIRGGLGAVWAPEKTRGAIAKGLKSRRCFATTGPRIYLDLSVDGHPVGADVRARSVSRIAGTVHGTAPLDAVRLFDRENEILCLHPNPPKRDPNRIRILWGGANSPDRGRFMAWHGGLSIAGGRIVETRPLNMFAAKYGIVEANDTAIRWRSVTSGNEAGMLLHVEGSDDALLAFEAGPARFTFTLGDVRKGDVLREFGGLEQVVSATCAHYAGDSADTQIDLRDPDLAPGPHAFWLRVEQRDFHRAWSSPIYVAVVKK